MRGSDRQSNGQQQGMLERVRVLVGDGFTHEAALRMAMLDWAATRYDRLDAMLHAAQATVAFVWEADNGISFKRTLAGTNGDPVLVGSALPSDGPRLVPRPASAKPKSATPDHADDESVYDGFLYLKATLKRDPTTPEIAEYIGVKPSAVDQRIKQFEKRGVLRRDAKSNAYIVGPRPDNDAKKPQVLFARKWTRADIVRVLNAHAKGAIVTASFHEMARNSGISRRSLQRGVERLAREGYLTKRTDRIVLDPGLNVDDAIDPDPKGGTPPTATKGAFEELYRDPVIADIRQRPDTVRERIRLVAERVAQLGYHVPSLRQLEYLLDLGSGSASKPRAQLVRDGVFQMHQGLLVVSNMPPEPATKTPDAGPKDQVNTETDTDATEADGAAAKSSEGGTAGDTGDGRTDDVAVDGNAEETADGVPADTTGPEGVEETGDSQSDDPVDPTAALEPVPYDARSKRGRVFKALVRLQTAATPAPSSAEIALEADVSKNSVPYHLAKMLRDGNLRDVGNGRSGARPVQDPDVLESDKAVSSDTTSSGDTYETSDEHVSTHDDTVSAQHADENSDEGSTVTADVAPEKAGSQEVENGSTSDGSGDDKTSDSSGLDEALDTATRSVDAPAEADPAVEADTDDPVVDPVQPVEQSPKGRSPWGYAKPRPTKKATGSNPATVAPEDVTESAVDAVVSELEKGQKNGKGPSVKDIAQGAGLDSMTVIAVFDRLKSEGRGGFGSDGRFQLTAATNDDAEEDAVKRIKDALYRFAKSWQAEPTYTAVANAVGMDRSRVVDLLRPLERDGLVNRKPYTIALAGELRDAMPPLEKAKLTRRGHPGSGLDEITIGGSFSSW